MNSKIRELIVNSGISTAEGFYAIVSGELRGNSVIMYEERSQLNQLVLDTVKECIKICDETTEEYARAGDPGGAVGIDAVKTKLTRLFRDA